METTHRTQNPAPRSGHEGSAFAKASADKSTPSFGTRLRPSGFAWRRHLRRLSSQQMMLPFYSDLGGRRAKPGAARRLVRPSFSEAGSLAESSIRLRQSRALCDLFHHHSFIRFNFLDNAEKDTFGRVPGWNWETTGEGFLLHQLVVECKKPVPRLRNLRNGFENIMVSWRPFHKPIPPTSK
jgi:hypothetical protein